MARLKNTQLHLNAALPCVVLDRGVLLQAPVWSRIEALFSSSRLPPPTSACHQYPLSEGLSKIRAAKGTS